MKLNILLCAFVLFLGACTKQKEDKIYSQDEVNRILDSTLKAHSKKSAIEMQKDLEIRAAIELRSKIDSIEKANKQAKK